MTNYVGDITVDVIRDAAYRVDGGAAFGVVPRTTWAKLAPPDRRGRITVAVNCYLIRTKRQNILVDTGLGNKLGEKWRDAYAVTKDGRLPAELAALGVSPEQIHYVVLTHLHFDHAGGATVRDKAGVLRVAFPNAVYLVQRRDWEEALHPNERTRPSFQPEDFLPLKETGRLRLLEGDSFVTPRVSLVVTGGHTTAHQLVRVASRGQVGYFPGDLLPAVYYLPPPYIPAYDLFPLTTLEAKKTLLRRAARKEALLFLSHEKNTPVGRVALDERNHYVFAPAAPADEKAPGPRPGQEKKV